MSERKELQPLLPSDLYEMLLDRGIKSSQEFITRNPLEVMKKARLSYLTYCNHLLAISHHIAPKPSTVLAMHIARGDRYLRTAMEQLDATLQGGIPIGAVTEVVGPAAVGKTQLCLQLSAMASADRENGGLAGGVIYIDTEGAFTAERLMEIATVKLGSFHHSTLRNVHVFSEMTCEDLMIRLEGLGQLVAVHGIKLVVVDSIASLVRKEFDTRGKVGTAKRFALLSKQANILKRVAESCGIPVIVTNQITGVVSKSAEDDWSEFEEQHATTAALGSSWAHCVNTRILLNPGKPYHQLSVVKSPLVSTPQNLYYNINTSGLSVIQHH